MSRTLILAVAAPLFCLACAAPGGPDPRAAPAGPDLGETLPALGPSLLAGPHLDRPPAPLHCDIQVADDGGSVQAAVDRARPGDTLCIGPGRHAAHLVLPAHDLTLVGTAGAASTVLDGGGRGRVVDASTPGDRTALTLRGLTLKGGRASEGAALWSVGRKLILDDVVVQGNGASSTGAVGAVVVLADGTTLASRLRVMHNHTVGSGARGAGIAVFGGALTLQNSEVVGNTATANHGSVQGVGIVVEGARLELAAVDISANGAEASERVEGVGVSIHNGELVGNDVTVQHQWAEGADVCGVGWAVVDTAFSLDQIDSLDNVGSAVDSAVGGGAFVDGALGSWRRSSFDDNVLLSGGLADGSGMAIVGGSGPDTTFAGSGLVFFRNQLDGAEAAGAPVSVVGDVDLQDVRIMENISTSASEVQAGGLWALGSASGWRGIDIRGNAVDAPRAQVYAGGLNVVVARDDTLANVVVAGNRVVCRAALSAGIALLGNQLAVDHLTVHGNTVDCENAESIAISVWAQSLDMTHLDVSDNHSFQGAPDLVDLGADTLGIRWSNVHGNSEDIEREPAFKRGLGNTEADPTYASAAGDRAADWDLHPGPGSALIDAGDPDQHDVDGSRADIGAYGGERWAW